MTDKEKIIAEIERQKEALEDYAAQYGDGHNLESAIEMVDSIIKFINSLPEEPISEDLEKELSRLLKDCEIDSEYIHQDFLHIVANHFADWQKERIMANSTNATIGLPYENKYGGYTHLIDVSRPLPVGNNKIAIIFNED